MRPRRHELFKVGNELVSQAMKDWRGQYAEVVRTAFSGWRDPRAKALRRRRAAVRQTKMWAVTGVGTGAGAVVVETASAAPGLAGPALIGAAALSGLAAVTSGFRAWRLHKEPLPEPPPPPVVLPARGSAAREPMTRLGEAEDSLRELLDQLSRGALVPPDSVVEARATGAEAAAALRGVAAQLQAVERARDHAPPVERGHLTDAVRALREQLDHGLEGYGGLLAAAARALAASSAATPRQDLTDATDRLAALASALRDLSRG
ncbi:hypothetical protein V5P93_005473 [Actinokineospora auranticolor]|uniref:Uncharacterized protein n=1 Tax=Actinokineospora auranticolor TaxID=155976 RepID=A0A2S6GQM2_9PSEU|nr:hypothetical protein [Actinokineospora auranticolor]PPK67496.1 hypothetical protein CLV40_107160 [Actinokineospora auranticolor]